MHNQTVSPEASPRHEAPKKSERDSSPRSKESVSVSVEQPRVRSSSSCGSPDAHSRDPPLSPPIAHSATSMGEEETVVVKHVSPLGTSSSEPLLGDSVSVTDRVELFERLCRRMDVLDDISRERDTAPKEVDHGLRRDEQFLTAIQAYRRAGRVAMGYSASSVSPSRADMSVAASIPSHLYKLCRAIIDGRERETALYGIETVAETIIRLVVEVGAFLLPR